MAAGKKISELSPDDTLTGEELVPLAEGSTKRTTAQAIADLASGLSESEVNALIAAALDGLSTGSFCLSYYFGSNLPIDTPIDLTPLDFGSGFPTDAGTALTRLTNGVQVNASGIYTISSNCLGRVTAGEADDVLAGCAVCWDGAEAMQMFGLTTTNGATTGIVRTPNMAATVYLPAGSIISVRPITHNGWTCSAAAAWTNILTVVLESLVP